MKVFRIWLQNQNRYMHPDEVADCFINELNNPTWETEQYINIEDEDGNMIYENDIVTTIESTIKGDVIINGIVEYSESFASYMINFPQYGVSKLLNDFIDLGLNVIGNIHNNSELVNNA